MVDEQQPSVRQEISGEFNATSVFGNPSVHYHQAPVSSEPPEHVWMIPYRRNPHFTGREHILQQLHSSFLTDRAAVLTQGQAISGLGGVGKTQIVVEYAYQHRDDYRFVLWINAASPSTLTADFLSIAHHLQLPQRVEQEEAQVVAAVRHWLATHDGWLLIVDNADDLPLVWPLLPTGSTGHVLLTTRNQHVGKMQGFWIDALPLSEGITFLLRRAGLLTRSMALEQVPFEDRVKAEELVRLMGSFPLALDQAGAYIEETSCGLARYLALYQHRQFTLLQRRGGIAGEHPDSVTTTWFLSFEKIDHTRPEAREMLHLCAFLAPDAIPEEILAKGAAVLEPTLANVLSDPLIFDDVMVLLQAYSLVLRDGQRHTLRMHRLVQEVLRESMDPAMQRVWAERVIRAVEAACPPVEHRFWSVWEQIVEQALVCERWVRAYHLHLPEAAHLLQQTGWYLAERARYSEAEPLLTSALTISEQIRGKEHLHTAASLYYLAGLYRNQGKYEQAEPLYERALTIREQELGSQHLDTATSLNNLGLIYRDQGMYEQAEPLLQQALAIREQQLGPQHLDTAITLGSLAGLYRNQGQHAQAESLYKRSLAIREQQLGPQHPDTAISLYYLAELYRDQGKYEQAESLHLRALAIREQQLGLQHPRTATSLTNLARLYQDQGKYEQAEAFMRRALAIYEQRLGEQHPYTMEVRKNYNVLLQTMKRA
ncbi:hypothetical protein KSC_044350 [Ktedonobacter sp. SOSP1-52]|uniref:tetratricopeptide repeat protein n=1 Tax=Ktedonobacter sp. SOSP1-52 TaxID=2778366 RepID=UPI001916847E|nr:tetratricopeptide repeat protein [Ktedonobacter sp. SOSP1-52]GHO65543.1 hypothetical protein KSC_044350 [Ktedonobacter sp. SOSP1-52]